MCKRARFAQISPRNFCLSSILAIDQYDGSVETNLIFASSLFILFSSNSLALAFLRSAMKVTRPAGVANQSRNRALRLLDAYRAWEPSCQHCFLRIDLQARLQTPARSGREALWAIPSAFARQLADFVMSVFLQSWAAERRRMVVLVGVTRANALLHAG